jgi:hypothetical protein
MSSQPATQRTGKPRLWRRRLLRLALVFVSLLVACLLGELLVRWRFAGTLVLYPRYHTAADYGAFRLRTIRPNSRFHHTSRDGRWEFRTNGAGFRNDRDFPHAKPPGSVRVLCLGDSHTQGYEVRQEATFASVIERRLAARGLKAEVLNAGVSGFGTAEQLAFLETEGIRYQPDVVVVGFFANDYEDNLKSGLFTLDDDGALRVAKTEHLPGVSIQDRLYALPFTKWLGENSYAYALAFNTVWDFYKHRLAARARAEVVEESAVATPGRRTDHEVRLADALLARLCAFARERGVRTIVLDIPAVSGDTPASSLEPATRTLLGGVVDALIPFEDLKARYADAVAWHVPHGQQHLSEAGHERFGLAAAELIEQWLTGPSSKPTNSHERIESNL